MQQDYQEQDLGFGNLAQQYTKPTFMLIDERAISQSEHTGLVFEAIANTTFIGSPTAGANGNITRAVLPGSIYLTFTGMDVRHIDGRQLQRVGLVPHVPVPRTIEALAAGRDEVLEKALELARE
ncbi:MAG TPA: S41 family peptidase [Thermoanaerobaculia bacterium]|nr:S41 family peptidase [Thermoanaerobaculia bacterium]